MGTAWQRQRDTSDLKIPCWKPRGPEVLVMTEHWADLEAGSRGRRRRRIGAPSCWGGGCAGGPGVAAGQSGEGSGPADQSQRPEPG